MCLAGSGMPANWWTSGGSEGFYNSPAPKNVALLAVHDLRALTASCKKWKSAVVSMLQDDDVNWQRLAKMAYPQLVPAAFKYNQGLRGAREGQRPEGRRSASGSQHECN